MFPVSHVDSSSPPTLRTRASCHGSQCRATGTCGATGKRCLHANSIGVRPRGYRGGPTKRPGPRSGPGLVPLGPVDFSDPDPNGTRPPCPLRERSVLDNSSDSSKAKRTRCFQPVESSMAATVARRSIAVKDFVRSIRREPGVVSRLCARVRAASRARCRPTIRHESSPIRIRFMRTGPSVTTNERPVSEQREAAPGWRTASRDATRDPDDRAVRGISTRVHPAKPRRRRFRSPVCSSARTTARAVRERPRRKRGVQS